LTLADGSRERLFTRDVALILIAQTAFGFGWSLYLLSPKFQAVVLGAGPDQIGVTTALSGLLGLLTVPFAAGGIDRLGRKLFFRIGSALVLVVSIGYFYVDRIGPLLFLLQGLNSAAFVLSFNASAALIADWAPSGRLGQAIGWLGAANVCMNAVATAIAEPLADRYGWHSMFIMGIVASCTALVLSLFVRNAPERPISVSPKGGSPMRDAGIAVWRPLVVSGLAGLVFCAVFIFIQPHALASGAREVRMFFIGFTASAVGCRLFFGDLGDRRGHRVVSLGAVVLYAVAALMCAWLKPELLWLYGLVFGAGHGVLYPTLNALVLARLPASRRGLGMALYNGAFNVGMTCGGFGWGLLAAHFGYVALFFTATAVALIATLPLLADRAPAAA
jgi:MFS family permease